MTTDTFKQLLEIMKKYEELILKHDWDENEEEFMKNLSIYFAKALYDEIPQIKYVIKHLQIMLEENGF